MKTYPALPTNACLSRPSSPLPSASRPARTSKGSSADLSTALEVVPGPEPGGREAPPPRPRTKESDPHGARKRGPKESEGKKGSDGYDGGGRRTKGATDSGDPGRRTTRDPKERGDPGRRAAQGGEESDDRARGTTVREARESDDRRRRTAQEARESDSHVRGRGDEEVLTYV